MQADTSLKKKLVVLGNGMAAGRVLEELFARAPDRYDVTIFGAEPRVNYDRIMLSPVLAGEKAFDDIIVHDDAWYAQHKVTSAQGRADRRDRPRGAHGSHARTARSSPTIRCSSPPARSRS